MIMLNKQAHVVTSLILLSSTCCSDQQHLVMKRLNRSVYDVTAFH